MGFSETRLLSQGEFELDLMQLVWALGLVLLCKVDSKQYTDRLFIIDCLLITPLLSPVHEYD